MCGERVGSAGDPIEGERDAHLRPDRRHAGVEFQGPLPATEFGGAVRPAIDPVRWHAGVQLERPPEDLGLKSVTEESQGLLQAALADVAPGADDVRVDFYAQFHG